MSAPPTREMVNARAEPRVGCSVVVPAHDCGRVLRESLDALLASDLPRAEWELIVVDDGSTDDTAVVAAGLADRVVATAREPRGPAYARNRGADAARGEILVFVDADVCVERTTLRRLVTTLATRPALSAVFGSYDARPRATGLVSQYRNLLHHYVHWANAGAATTFWAGCGAVRRQAFVQVGMFDERRYARPSIEDIELGYRLSDAGHEILLDPTIQGTHLKRWTLGVMLRTDLAARAIPWTRLLLERRRHGARGAVLNARPAERAYAVLVLAAIAAIGAAAWTRAWTWGIVAVIALVPVLAGNAHFLTWLARERGAWFALRVIPLRLLFYVVSAIGAAWASVGFVATRGAGSPRMLQEDVG